MADPTRAQSRSYSFAIDVRCQWSPISDHWRAVVTIPNGGNSAEFTGKGETAIVAVQRAIEMVGMRSDYAETAIEAAMLADALKPTDAKQIGPATVPAGAAATATAEGMGYTGGTPGNG